MMRAILVATAIHVGSRCTQVLLARKNFILFLFLPYYLLHQLGLGNITAFIVFNIHAAFNIVVLLQSNTPQNVIHLGLYIKQDCITPIVKKTWYFWTGSANTVGQVPPNFSKLVFPMCVMMSFKEIKSNYSPAFYLPARLPAYCVTLSHILKRSSFRVKLPNTIVRDGDV